jgi:hypothetical protein
MKTLAVDETPSPEIVIQNKDTIQINNKLGSERI